MQNLRMLGHCVHNLCMKKGVPNQVIMNAIDISEYDLDRFFHGMIFLTFKELDIVARILGMSLKELLDYVDKHKDDTPYYVMLFPRQCGHTTRSIHDMLDYIESYIMLKEEIENLK